MNNNTFFWNFFIDSILFVHVPILSQKCWQHNDIIYWLQTKFFQVMKIAHQSVSCQALLFFIITFDWIFLFRKGDEFEKKVKVQCLECNAVFYQYYRKTYNSKQHSTSLKEQKVERYQILSASKNVFEACTKSSSLALWVLGGVLKTNSFFRLR